MKQSLYLSGKQNIILTRKLQQAIQLLKLSTCELQQEIQNQLDSNPMLEVTSIENSFESPPEAYLSTQDEVADVQWPQFYSSPTYSSPTYSSPTYSSQTSNYRFNEDNYDYHHLSSGSLSLQEYLRWQLELTPITDTDKIIASVIIDTINEDGYLTTSLSDIHNSFNSLSYPPSFDEVNAVAHRIQHLDPIGCGILSLKETLVIQLGELSPDTPYLALAKKIIHEDIRLLASYNQKHLMQKYQIDRLTVEKVMKLICQLHPRPGNVVSRSQPYDMKPDLTVQKINNRWHVELNPHLLPRLGINSYYASLIRSSKNAREGQYLKNSLNEARWFLKSVQTRHETLLKVARYIVDYQKEFLDAGEGAMKPLILNEVADAIGMSESTISRVTTQKFIYTPRGSFELSYFFSSRVPMSNGNKCSSIAVKSVIKKLIQAENHQRPLSDTSLTELMNQEGIKIARRTVTKYREAMLIAPASERTAL